MTRARRGPTTARTRGGSRKTKLTHVAANGSVRMVDVSGKSVSQRRATAMASIVMQPETLRTIKRGAGKKGDVLVTAQLAGIQAAKKTADLIPLCHVLPLTHVQVDCTPHGDKRVNVRCSVTCSGKTGVEMEALTGAAIAALTIYDMCKAIDRAISIQNLQLLEKSGGRSGHFKREF